MIIKRLQENNEKLFGGLTEEAMSEGLAPNQECVMTLGI